MTVRALTLAKREVRQSDPQALVAGALAAAPPVDAPVAPAAQGPAKDSLPLPGLPDNAKGLPKAQWVWRVFSSERDDLVGKQLHGDAGGALDDGRHGDRRTDAS